MKINNKGFTLIEVIAVVLMLAIIVAIVLPSVFGYLDTSKDRSEEIFVGEMERIIGEYIALEGRNMTFDTNNGKKREKCDPMEGDSSCVEVIVYKNKDKVTFNDLTNSGLIKITDIINPKNGMQCSPSTEIIVYRDEDYVYCYETKLDCVDSKDNKNVINTCNFNWNDLSS